MQSAFSRIPSNQHSVAAALPTMMGEIPASADAQNERLAIVD